MAKKKSFEKSIDAINKFGKVSGLFLNADKTQAIWLGSKKYSTKIYAAFENGMECIYV